MSQNISRRQLLSTGLAAAGGTLATAALAAEGNKTWNPPAGPLQIIILTCHPDRFDYLSGARHYDLARLICK